MPLQPLVGVVDVVGGGGPVAAYVVGGVEHQEAPALAEAGARRPGRVGERAVDDGRVDRLRRCSCGPSCGGVRRPGTPWGPVSGEPCLTTSSRCGPRSRRSAGPPPAAATSGSRSPRSSPSCASWFREQCAARGLDVEADGNGNLLAWWRSRSARPVGANRRRAGRLAPRLGPRRRGVRRPARRGLLARGDRPAPRARRGADAGRSPWVPSPRRRGRGSGSPAWARGWPPARPLRRRPRELRDRGRRTPARRDGRRRRLEPALGRADWLDRIGCFLELHVEQGRDLVDRDAPVGLATGDLAARPLPLRLHRRGQPCRHDADGGPARPDAQLRDDRAGGRQAGPARRPARHLRPARRRAQRHQRDPVAGDRVAGRPLRQRGVSWRGWWPRSSARAPSGPAATAPGSRSRPSRSRARSPSTRALTARSRAGLADRWGDVPVIPTMAGHDAGILAAAGVPTAMMFVRNPTGVSHSPEEFADDGRLPRRRRGAGRRARGAGLVRLRLEHALLEDGVADDVLVEIEDGVITSVDWRQSVAVGRCIADSHGFPVTGDTPASPSPASPTATATRSTGRCGGAPRPERGSFWTWREQMYAVAAELTPDTLLRARPRHLRGDARDRDHGGRGVPLPAPPARRDAVRRPQRDGQGAARRGRRGRDPDPAARHLLPRRRVRPAARGRAGALLRRRRARAGPSGSPRSTTRGSARPSTRCAPCRATS